MNELTNYFHLVLHYTDLVVHVPDETSHESNIVSVMDRDSYNLKFSITLDIACAGSNEPWEELVIIARPTLQASQLSMQPII